MNKKLTTLAVAAAMAAPVAAMADATLYGTLHVSIDYADVKNAASLPIYDRDGVRIADGQDFKGWGVNRGSGYLPGVARANRIGVKGSEDLGNGLKAIYQVELGVSFQDTNNNLINGGDAITMRNSFVGLAGNWGTFLIGRHDTPLKISTGKLDLFADTMADYNGTVGFQDLRADSTVAYISPSFSGFQFAAATIAGQGSTAEFERNFNSDSINEAWSIAAMYKNGPWYASAAYESIGNDMFMDGLTSELGQCPLNSASCDYVDDNFTKWRLGLGILDWNGFTLTAIYEDQDNLPGGQTYRTDPISGVIVADSIKGQKLWQIQAGYAFGNNMVKAMYGSADRDDRKFFDDDTLSVQNLRNQFSGNRNTWAIAFDHNFSKRTKAYVVYTDVSDDEENTVRGAQWSGFSLGMTHKF